MRVALARLLVGLLLIAAGCPRGASAQGRDPGGESPPGGEAADRERAQLGGRIAVLLGEVASSARQIEHPPLRLACQLEAAGLLWEPDPDAARRVFEEAFEWVSMVETGREPVAGALVPPLLTATARYDPALAERFAQRLAILSQRAARADAEADMSAALAEAGIEMLPGDPERAAEFGRAALASGIRVPALRLLIVLRGVDPARADALFASALAASLQPPGPTLAEAATASSYFLATGASRADGIPPDLIRAFLEHAARLIFVTQPDAPDAPAAYFLGRQLGGMFNAQLPDRAAEVSARVAALALSDRMAQRRSENRRAVEKWLPVESAGERPVDPRAASAVRNAQQGRFNEAEREIARVQEPGRRVALLLGVSAAAAGRGHKARAIEAICDAERECRRVRAPAERAPLLFRVVAACAGLDTVLAFSTLQSAVDALNAATRALDAPTAPAARPNFAGAFNLLAREDFDGALLAARRIEGRSERLFAQLAICRGGLGGADDE